MKHILTALLILGVYTSIAQQSVSQPLVQNVIQSNITSYGAVADTSFVLINSLSNWSNTPSIKNAAHDLTGQYVLKNRLGIYGQLSNDQSGRYRMNAAQLGLSRAVRLGSLHLGLGLAMKWVGIQLNANALQLYQNDDPSFPSATLRDRVFDFKSDISIGNERFIAGAQVSNFLGHSYSLASNNGQFNHLERSILMYGGGNMFEKGQWRARAFASIQLAENSLSDINTTVVIDFMRAFQLGLLYQLNGPLGMHIGLTWNKLQFAYAYRMPRSAYALPATHSLSLGFGFSRSKGKN